MLKYRIVANLILTILLFFVSNTVNAQTNNFQSTFFDISVADNLKLISKTESKDNDFYRYVFATSVGDDAEQQMRIIVSARGPSKNQTQEAFELESIGAMSAMFIDSFKLYKYLQTPENKKVLASKPYHLTLGSVTFSGATMYFGEMDVSFLVSHIHRLTYAITLISNNKNEKARKANLQSLTDQLKTIKFNSVVE